MYEPLIKKYSEQGKDPENIIHDLKELAQREVVYFLVDTLEYLYKGGRIGNTSYLIGSMLQMKPILGIDDGKVTAIEKQRTSTKALNRLKELVLAECPKGVDSMITVSHCSGQERAEKLTAELTQALKIPYIPVYEVPPAIVVHGGQRIISVSFFKQT